MSFASSSKQTKGNFCQQARRSPRLFRAQQLARPTTTNHHLPAHALASLGNYFISSIIAHPLHYSPAISQAPRNAMSKGKNAMASSPCNMQVIDPLCTMFIPHRSAISSHAKKKSMQFVPPQRLLHFSSLVSRCAGRGRRLSSSIALEDIGPAFLLRPDLLVVSLSVDLELL